MATKTILDNAVIGKNCLNKFRQDNGYKEGTYIKEWNGREDNVVMIEIIETMENVSFDILDAELTKAYSKCK